MNSAAAAGAPHDWFPPDRGPVLIIGNAGSVFPRHLAALWRSMGLDARIVTRRWGAERELPGGIPVIAAEDAESARQRTFYAGVERASWLIESRVTSWQRDRYRRAMGSETTYRPYLSPWTADALSISRVVRALRPQFVCGQEVFAYGLATALCGGVPRLLMPWGGDIHMYCNTSSIASAAVRYALNHADLVVPGSPLTKQYLHERFGVPLDRMHCGGLWALDRARFNRQARASRPATCQRFGIDPGRLIVMNIRRFFPAWGSDLALPAFVRFARENPSPHFVMLGGAGTEPHVNAARRLLHEQGVSHRFTLFDGEIPLEECAALMSAADIVVSLMRERDMRPLSSILEAAACGAAPVLSDQDEYRAMERLGFRALFCAAGDEEAVMAALRQYADDPSLRSITAGANEGYLEAHEDGRQQATDLLRRIRLTCDGHGSNREPAARR